MAKKIPPGHCPSDRLLCRWDNCLVGCCLNLCYFMLSLPYIVFYKKPYRNLQYAVCRQPAFSFIVHDLNLVKCFLAGCIKFTIIGILNLYHDSGSGYRIFYQNVTVTITRSVSIKPKYSLNMAFVMVLIFRLFNPVKILSLEIRRQPVMTA